jgi:ABC-type transport system involved in multi-copper enzyme maturation permease subunit
MLTLIIQKELKDIISDTKFFLSFLICSILIIGAFYAGSKSYQSNVARYEASKRENIRQLEGYTDWMEVQQTRILLPPEPLSALVTGVSNDIGQTATLSGRGAITPEDSRYGDDPIYAVFRFLDLEFLFGIVLTLFAILFAYDSISGEKERGTLRLTFANGVTRATYLLAKIIGSFLAMVIPLLIPFLIGMLVFTWSGTHLTGDEWLRLILIILTGFMLFGVFLALSVFVSTLTHRSSYSFLVLLIVWVMTVMVIPRISALVMGRVVDVPTTAYLESLKGRYNSQLSNERRSKIPTFKASQTQDMEAMMKEFQKFMADLADDQDKKSREYSGSLDEDRDNKTNRQTALSLGLARLSPAASFSLAVSSLAGTSLSLKQLFQQEAEGYQQAFSKFMVAKTGVNIGGMRMRLMKTDAVKPKPINPYELPVFNFRSPRLGELFSSVVIDWGILLFGIMVFFAGSFVAFLRYDVR